MSKIFHFVRCLQTRFFSPTLLLVFYSLADDFSSKINQNFFFFFFFLFQEQLEEDKLHSNGGKVLSSELKNAHSGRSLSVISAAFASFQVGKKKFLMFWLMQFCAPITLISISLILLLHPPLLNQLLMLF